MNEVFPVAAGLIAGVVLGGVTARQRPWLWLLVSVLLGLTATVVSGEWKVSWAYLLVDVPLVAVSAVTGYAVSRRLVLRGSTGARPNSA